MTVETFCEKCGERFWSESVDKRICDPSCQGRKFDEITENLLDDMDILKIWFGVINKHLTVAERNVLVNRIESLIAKLKEQEGQT